MFARRRFARYHRHQVRFAVRRGFGLGRLLGWLLLAVIGFVLLTHVKGLLFFALSVLLLVSFLYVVIKALF